MILRSILVVSFLLVVAPAQVKQDPPARKPDPTAGEALNDAGEPMFTTDGRGAKLTPEQRALAGVRRGASSHCQFLLHTRPTKLMPGETGKLIVTAVLKGKAVLPSPAPLEVTSANQQGVFSLGPAEFRPARIGRLEKGYVGRPVYDNYMMLEMPITVSTDAKVGQQHNVAVEMKFDLYDGDTAQSIGTFVDRAMGRVEIGRSFDPAVRGGYTPPAAAEVPAEPAAVGNGADDAAGNGRDPARTEALGGAANRTVDEQPAAAEPAPAQGAESDPVVTDDESSLWILFAAGGALLAAVLLLAFKRK